jgi:hypothetical protein
MLTRYNTQYIITIYALSKIALQCDVMGTLECFQPKISCEEVKRRHQQVYKYRLYFFSIKLSAARIVI